MIYNLKAQIDFSICAFLMVCKTRVSVFLQYIKRSILLFKSPVADYQNGKRLAPHWQS